MSGLEHLFGSDRGAYIPLAFAEACSHWSGLPSDFDDLLQGPEGLWAYCEELRSDREYQDFFGEPKA